MRWSIPDELAALPSSDHDRRVVVLTVKSARRAVARTYVAYHIALHPPRYIGNQTTVLHNENLVPPAFSQQRIARLPVDRHDIDLDALHYEPAVPIQAQALDQLVRVEQVGPIYFLKCLYFSNMFLRGHKHVYGP